MPAMIFAQNGDTSHGCPHPALRYVVDCGYHTIGCERCRKRWTLMDPGVAPKYSEDGLLNHTDVDREYPGDKCVDPVVLMPQAGDADRKAIERVVAMLRERGADGAVIALLDALERKPRAQRLAERELAARAAGKCGARNPEDSEILCDLDSGHEGHHSATFPNHRCGWSR